MKSHQLIHSGQHAYSCNVCKKTFSQMCNMKIHQLIHSGQLPYACDVWKKRLIGSLTWWGSSLYVFACVHMPVICVITRSVKRHRHTLLTWVYLVEHFDISVICARKLSLTCVIWRHIKAHIVESVHVAVLCVMKLLVCRFNWRVISNFQVSGVRNKSFIN
jgi:hypothetical protein